MADEKDPPDAVAGEAVLQSEQPEWETDEQYLALDRVLTEKILDFAAKRVKERGSGFAFLQQAGQFHVVCFVDGSVAAVNGVGHYERLNIENSEQIIAAIPKDFRERFMRLAALRERARLRSSRDEVAEAQLRAVERKIRTIERHYKEQVAEIAGLNESERE